MFDTAEAYASGQSEVEMQVPAVLDVGFWLPMLTYISRGRVIKELGLRRTDLVISTKIFWGLRKGPNDGGLSRKQCVAAALVPNSPSVLNRRNYLVSLKAPKKHWPVLGWTMLI